MTTAPPTGADPVSPGGADPHPPAAPAVLARRLGVPPGRLLAWIDRGLPVGSDGLVDPVAAVAWLSDGRIAECPALARRWRAWFAWFSPHAAGPTAARRWRVRRTAALHLPGPVQGVRWDLPLLPAGTDRRAPPDGVLADGTWRIAAGPQAGGLERRLAETVEAAPCAPVDDPPLLALVEDLAAGFRYAYRRHRPGLPFRAGSGSCVDCAVALGRRLEAAGRPWRLVGGVVARDALAGVHAWVEAEVAGGAWVPLDPTLPTVARQLGGPGVDWRAWARAWTGGIDAGRVVLGRCAPEGWAPVVGSAQVLAEGAWRDAWACIDLACGDCRWSFRDLSR